MNFRYFDIHSHLNLSEFDQDREEVIARLKEQGIAAITVGVDADSSSHAVALADAHKNLFACVGLHPADNTTETFNAEIFRELLKNPKTVAIGECGFDYFRDESPETKARQREIFLAHITLAEETGKPLMIHARPSKGSMDAYEDVLDVLEQHPGMKANFHFFAGDVRIAQRAASLGFTMSFDGPITFAREYDEVIRSLPLELIMAETDAPFAAPASHRGRRNSPEYVSEIYGAIASIRGEDPEMVRKTINETASRVFGLPV